MANKDTLGMIEDKVKSLPLVDVAVFEIISLLNNPDSNFELIVKKLSPGIAARFLKMANSAYYGREVRSINRAVRLLGYNKMKQILITSIVMEHFTKCLDFENFNFDKFQKQAHFCAAVSRVLGEILDYRNLEDLFTAAILHNIGKLVITIYFKDEHKEIIALKKSEGISTHEAEQRVLGATHAEIGAIVLKRFNIPRDICDSVRFHDAKDSITPEESGFQLKLITRESARIIDNFVLPEEMNPLEIIDRLKGTIEEGQKIYREGVKREMRSKGYQEIFPALLEQASSLVYRDLKKDLQEKVPHIF